MSILDALIAYIALPLLNFLTIVIIISIVLSWLISFNVINSSNQVVSVVWRMTSTLTEPLLGPIRRILPPLGGLDLSPLVLILLVTFVERVLGSILRGTFTGLF
ncbi:MAG: YggT family protein [Maricaulis sp.]|uniref:YggT family protein n=1 Tax=Maricaulis sp. TaxID=1486257 RepID=UPI001B1800CC|nr:YggT family protein [Maricaulis sp.]MBO6728923.1 YggT family protein [Maricaulis sp.]MBO6847578.1 YggT family protein [Maricaulis sp.]MBO6876995.1 YggT family protein [Maricaulis sp.]MDM7985288.1 YggT family protein [Maricaulis sp.]